jgi:L-serine deaminase
MNQVWFTADDIFHAKELLRQCEDEEINISDLPLVEERNRGIQLDFCDSMLESDSIS